MSKVIVITGASSGFGALTARALAAAGHRVYAGMRETSGRNAPQVANLTVFAATAAGAMNPCCCCRCASIVNTAGAFRSHNASAHTYPKRAPKGES